MGGDNIKSPFIGEKVMKNKLRITTDDRTVICNLDALVATRVELGKLFLYCNSITIQMDFCIHVKDGYEVPSEFYSERTEFVKEFSNSLTEEHSDKAIENCWSEMILERYYCIDSMYLSVSVIDK